MMSNTKLLDRKSLSEEGKRFFRELVKNTPSSLKDDKDIVSNSPNFDNQKKIELVNVTKRFKTKFGWKTIFEDLNLSLPQSLSIGILGKNGEGKSTLVKLLAGLEHPDKGEIRKNGIKFSWPIGGGGNGINASMTGRENVKFICRLYNEDFKKKAAFIENFASLGAYMDLPVRTYSKGMKKRLVFAVNMAFEFDTYLIDEGFSGGDAKMKKQTKSILDEKKEKYGTNLIIVSHSTKLIETFCDVAAILKDGKLKIYDDMQEAFSVYENL